MQGDAAGTAVTQRFTTAAEADIRWLNAGLVMLSGGEPPSGIEIPVREQGA